MEKKYIISLDQGTTSSRAIIFNKNKIEGIANVPLKCIYPNPGWVEQDPEEIFQSQIEACKNALKMAGISPEELACLGIANQRETTIIWDKFTGKPVYNAIVWQCRRTSDLCSKLQADGAGEIIKQKTGLIIDAYFSGSKIKWILDHVDGARKMTEEGRLLSGTVDSWLIWRLTDGKVHATDVSNASRTMLYNIQELRWDQELLKLFEIPKNMLAEVKPSSSFYGNTVEAIFGSEIPITGVAGDQQAALFGQACFESGYAKTTYGTGSFILMNTGSHIVQSKNNLLTTIAWDLGNGVQYALEGSVFNGGSAIQWLRDEMGIIDTPHEANLIAETTEDTAGVYVVPAYTGLGAPYWDMYARGLIIGITRGVTRNHIIRATLESLAYSCRDIFEAMQGDCDIKLKEIKVDGGASVSDFLMQFQADILGIDVNRSKIIETTALGVAYLAGLYLGIWKDLETIKQSWSSERLFNPLMETAKKEALYNGWKKAVGRSLNWA